MGRKIKESWTFSLSRMFFFSFIFVSWRLITLQYCSGFCRTLTWISHEFTCVPHPDPPSHLPLYPIPLGLPSAPGPSTCLSLSRMLREGKQACEERRWIQIWTFWAMWKFPAGSQKLSSGVQEKGQVYSDIIVYMNRGNWQAAGHLVTKSWTRLSYRARMPAQKHTHTHREISLWLNQKEERGRTEFLENYAIGGGK